MAKDKPSKRYTEEEQLAQRNKNQRAIIGSNEPAEQTRTIKEIQAAYGLLTSVGYTVSGPEKKSTEADATLMAASKKLLSACELFGEIFRSGLM
ncbi:hypothetical protein LCGC14_0425550 [marine sediment metagenome]|uniref:Uncharacterized protein n=1 Tax=marine sediment metagenome TaxID=412755 RepID=A0A0F9VYY1_9ZZZZ